HGAGDERRGPACSRYPRRGAGYRQSGGSADRAAPVAGCADADHPAGLPGQDHRHPRPCVRAGRRLTMTKLKLGPLPDDKPVKVTVELPAPLHRDLVAYAEVLARETGQPAADPVRLIVPMLERFIATDRGFAKARRTSG